MLFRLPNREIIFNKPNLIIFFHALMAAQFPLHIAKATLKQIACLRDIQFGKLLESKQVIQIPLQAVKRASQPLMRVMRFTCFKVDGTLVQEVFRLLQPAR